MNERIIEVSNQGMHLKSSLKNIVILSEGGEKARLPFEDISCIIVQHPRSTITLSALADMADHNVSFIVCDDSCKPTAMLLPLDGNFIQAKRFLAQAGIKKPLKKRLWKKIIVEKIVSQANLLVKLFGEDFGLYYQSKHVKSGDPENIEAHASRIYWNALFHSTKFRRERFGGGPNAQLNYGYAILRATLARAIVSSGLHPSLGLHHHNQYNAFCLADDLMEPFRPLVDEIVYDLFCLDPEIETLTSEHKKALLQILTNKYFFNGTERALFDWCLRLTSSLVKVIMGKEKDLKIARLL